VIVTEHADSPLVVSIAKLQVDPGCEKLAVGDANVPSNRGAWVDNAE
jgi:hypothetical protein